MSKFTLAIFRVFLIAFILSYPLFNIKPASSETPISGTFHAFPHKDPLTDEDRSAIFNMGENKIRRSISLAWSCRIDGLNVLLMLNSHFGGDSLNNVYVRYRFDTESPSEPQKWELLQKKEFAVIPMPMVAEFTSLSLRSQRLFLRVTDPLDKQTKENTFLLNGLAEGLKTLPCAKPFH